MLSPHVEEQLKKTSFLRPWSQKIVRDPRATSDDYFKKIITEFNLNQIYRIVDSCYYRRDQQLVPIIIKIEDAKLIEYNDNK